MYTRLGKLQKTTKKAAAMMLAVIFMLTIIPFSNAEEIFTEDTLSEEIVIQDDISDPFSQMIEVDIERNPLYSIEDLEAADFLMEETMDKALGKTARYIVKYKSASSKGLLSQLSTRVLVSSELDVAKS